MICQYLGINKFIVIKFLKSITESFESLQKEPFQSDIENQKIFKPNEFLNDVRIDDVSSDSSSKDQKSELGNNLYLT